MLRLLDLVPFEVRVGVARLRAQPKLWREARRYARSKGDVARFPFVHAQHETPLRRPGSDTSERLQRAKERNVARCAELLNGTLIGPGETFSFHHAVGWPNRLRGFGVGLELHNGELASGVGGGNCSVSNLLYLLALRSGLQIVERHRHQLDLFPDHGRTVPFGCGATVFYPHRDLKITNPWPFALCLGLRVEDGALHGEVRAAQQATCTIEVYEIDHHIRRDGDTWWRENRIRRRGINRDGSIAFDEEVAHNMGRCLYAPEQG